MPLRKFLQQAPLDEAAAKYDALMRSQAVIEFDLNGNIITANENFLNAMGYSLDEVKGKHHSMFVDPDFARSDEYHRFWDHLRRGEYDAKEYRRLGRDGKEIWIQASYNPVFDDQGRPYKVVKFATDITQQKMHIADVDGQVQAIGRSQAVIEFNLDGIVQRANENFLKAVGYSLHEIQGQHHRMFVDPHYAQSLEYGQFWDNLRRGQFEAGEYKRLAKGGREVWIQASYNPIFDMNGRPFKVVKYATDITNQKLQNADYRGQIEAINKVQAVIEFDLDGRVINANPAFLNAIGYSLDEIRGQHHRMFVDQDHAKSDDYREFWKGLREGRVDSGVYHRVAKGSKDIWINASYNPIFDSEGRPFKVVKYADDITDMICLTEQTTRNVQSVAAAAEEMSASIAEISKNMALSKQATDDITMKTSQSNTAAMKLVDTMQSMERIVTLIKDIAGQVNLLALNATIEAARAGEAGKGFAVVASEVKNLANQTASATDDIAREIKNVQDISKDVASSVNEIIQSADAVNTYVNGVAAAIEEQSVVTRDISQNSQHMSDAVNEILNHIKRVS